MIEMISENDDNDGRPLRENSLMNTVGSCYYGVCAVNFLLCQPVSSSTKTEPIS